jgi:uncharacterized damage-inducible protein DinB
MTQEISAIISRMEEIFTGEPWYGKSVMTVIGSIDPEKVYIRPSGHSHSLMDLLYHMLNWEQFTLQQLLSRDRINTAIFEALDWRDTTAELYTWEIGIEELKAIHTDIIRILSSADNSLLQQPVFGRDYKMHYLLNGLIDHNIYHCGQLAYLAKLLS